MKPRETCVEGEDRHVHQTCELLIGHRCVEMVSHLSQHRAEFRPVSAFGTDRVQSPGHSRCADDGSVASRSGILLVMFQTVWPSG